MKGTILLITCLVSVSFSSAQDILCSEVPAGEISLFPYPNDCTKYYECIEGVKFIKECSNGLWFSNELQSCDHPDVSGCVEVTDVPPTTPRPACAPDIVDVFPYPYDCSLYLECYKGILELQSCPAGLWFNAGEKRCVYPTDADCIQPTSTYVPTFTAPDSVCWGVRPGETLLKPFPGDCNRYVECFGSIRTDMQCPPELYFSYLKQLCDWPSLTGCDDTTRIPDPSTTENPSPPTPPNGDDDPRCANGNTEYWPHPECTKYIECYEGHGYEMDCPRGLYFNPDDKKCEDTGGYPCGKVTTPDVPTSTRGDDWTPDPLCPSPSGRYLFPYPGDCTKFLECAEGVRFVESCPEDLWFNPTLLVCDYPYQAGCVWAYLHE